jgi:predicted nucleic acid-binding protein
VNPVVIDASAGVEVAADTFRGRALRTLLPAEAVPRVPELLFVECGAVLRRWDPHPDTRADRSGPRCADGLAAARHPGAWFVRRRKATTSSVSFADAVYVALAAHLGADLLSDDGRLATLLACRFGWCTCQVDR